MNPKTAIEALHEDSRSLWIPARVPEYTHNPGISSSALALSFLRDHVARSVPCVWRGAASQWESTKTWHIDGMRALRERAGCAPVRVAWTPDGRADAIVEVEGEEGNAAVEKVFAMPHEREQTLSSLLDALVGDCECNNQGATSFSVGDQCVAGKAGDGVAYYSAQDSNLTREVPALLKDVDDQSIAFARQAFGCDATATNVWIGDGRSVSTMHTDPYENMFAVVHGRKRFALRPPCDAAFLRKPELRRARWRSTHGHMTGEENESGEELRPLVRHSGWRLVREEGKTAWIDEKGSGDEKADVLFIEVRKGDLLYLPGLWCM